MAELDRQTVIQERNGSRIYVSPRHNGNGLLVAQGGAHILFSDEELRIFADHIVEHLKAKASTA